MMVVPGKSTPLKHLTHKEGQKCPNPTCRFNGDAEAISISEKDVSITGLAPIKLSARSVADVIWRTLLAMFSTLNLSTPLIHCGLDIARIQSYSIVDFVMNHRSANEWCCFAIPAN